MVGRPTTLPLSHRLSLMHEHVVVQLGFRTRPLRDGGGRRVPPLRKETGITSIGQKIIELTSELNQAVQMFISCGEKNHPSSEELFSRIRQCLGATEEDGVAEGQPFFPHFDFQVGQNVWRPGLGVPTDTSGRGASGSGRAHSYISRCLANKRGAQRCSRRMGRPIPSPIGHCLCCQLRVHLPLMSASVTASFGCRGPLLFTLGYTKWHGSSII